MGEQSNRVQVYTGNFCGYCTAAKRLLSARGISYEEINISQIEGAREALVERTGWRTIPVIEIDGELVGGFMELRALDMSGGLEHLSSSD